MNRDLRHTVLCLVVAAVAYACPAAAQSPEVVVGPYLQNVTTDGIVVRWATSIATDPTDFEYHRAPISGCKPGTTYDVHVGDNDEFEVSFTTAPAADRPFHFVVYGDTRSNPGTHAQVASAIADEKPCIVLHTGDLIADGRKPELWISEFFGPAEPIISKTALYPVLGNHEKNSAYYFNFFDLPGNERYYSFDYGNVHIVMLDSNDPPFPKEHRGETRWIDEHTKLRTRFWHDQVSWLKNDLADNTDAVLTVVCQHAPIYSSRDSDSRQRLYAKMRRWLQPVLEQYEVDLVFSGHNHFYERNAVNGIQYIVTGGGGASMYSGGDKLPTEQARAAVNHYVVVTVDGANVKVRTKAVTGETLDLFSLRTDK